jgi:hypothetical protein
MPQTHSDTMSGQNERTTLKCPQCEGPMQLSLIVPGEAGFDRRAGGKMF